MSTLDTFREMSGITETSKLQITPERALAVINTVSANHTKQATSFRVTLLPVSTYVNQSKEPDSGLVYVRPNRLPFTSHWGIVIGDPALGGSFLLHLLLRGDGATRCAEFRVSNVKPDSEWIVGATVQLVGETKYSIPELTRIGEEMITAFGNYHLIFWNCQMFAKCYLRVITEDDAVFTQWTSADVTNLFLCALVVPIPGVSTSKHRKMKQLYEIAMETPAVKELARRVEGQELTEEELFSTSDSVIDLMKAAWSDDETLKKLSPIKDKIGLMSAIQGVLMKALGYSRL
jgi:hypothetical protein